MEPDPEPIDLSVLDPRRDAPRFDAAVSRIAERAVAQRRLRRAVVRRGLTGLAIAMAAGLLLWFLAPRRPEQTRSPDILDWATREIGADDVLGVAHAQ